MTTKTWEEKLSEWIKTQHGTAGWEMKLESFIRAELTKLKK